MWEQIKIVERKGTMRNINFLRKMIVVPLISLVLINISSIQSVGDYIEEEKTIVWRHGQNLHTGVVYKNGILFINITNLQSSASGVNITRDPSQDDIQTWSPYVPLNFTLDPGESYSETTTLEEFQYEEGGFFIFGCSVLTEDSSATIRFGYQIQKQGVSPVPNIGFITTLLTLTSLVVIVRIKSKNTKRK